MKWLFHYWMLFLLLVSAGPAVLAAVEDDTQDVPDIDDLSIW